MSLRIKRLTKGAGGEPATPEVLSEQIIGQWPVSGPASASRLISGLVNANAEAERGVCLSVCLFVCRGDDLPAQGGSGRVALRCPLCRRHGSVQERTLRGTFVAGAHSTATSPLVLLLQVAL